MARSKREIPHYYLESVIDLHGVLAWLADLNVGRALADRILPAAVLLKGAALAAREVPGMNGFYRDGAFEQQEHVHLGVAVSLRGGGLIAPALHDADRLPLADLMAGMKDLVTRARTGRLRASEMSDPTITVTSLGELGAELVHGVIYPPQVALVGFGRIVERPWAVDGMLAVRPTVTVTLAADHRVSDGHQGGLLLAAIEDRLKRPEEL
jgi:pyruvate dehydrogenase E2 component (dihydrolipoamide acetyltransferase)